MIARLIKILTITALLGVSVVFGVFYYYYQETDLDADRLINYAPDTSSEILDRHGNRIAYVFKARHRLYATYNEIPPYLIEALVAIEDTKFFEHCGVNPDAILRAIVRDIKAGHFVEGGSTITQQLIKVTLLTSQKKLKRKLREAILAIKIENHLTKEQILERYLNEIPYGNNYYGVKTAAQGYFHKRLQDLTLKESALLVGLPNAPSYYNPLKHYKRALNRANAILFRMKSLGWLSDDEYLKATKESPPIYRTTLTQNVAPYIADEVLRRFKGRFGDIRTGGYKIYTTVDLKMQQAAKKALKNNFGRLLRRYKLNRHKTSLNGAIVAVENSTGDILAMVGGEEYRHSQYNRITMSKRQPGSAFKPFVYQTALDMGYNPATKLTDLARTFGYTKNGKHKVWAPKNYEHDYKGFITLREALVHSRNLATINLVADIGVEVIRKRLALLDVPHIPKDLSIALGNLGISPLKMAQMYTVFSNHGHMIEPRLVSKIVSREGSVLFETKPKEIANFTKPQQAYLMTDILKDVILRGTGRNARVRGIELAGKTGTTNDGVDAWFCGYSPSITTIVWHGRDDNRPIGRHATGGSISAPVFGSFYRQLMRLYPDIPKHFVKPSGVYVGKIGMSDELYTDISPLPGNSAQKLPNRGIKAMFDSVSSDTQSVSDDEDEESDMEVMDMDSEPQQDQQNRPNQPPEIDPLHLKHIKPKRVGEDIGELF